MDFYDILALIGYFLLVLGIGLISLPAAMIAGGLILILFGLFGARSHARSTISTQSNAEPGD